MGLSFESRALIRRVATLVWLRSGEAVQTEDAYGLDAAALDRYGSFGSTENPSPGVNGRVRSPTHTLADRS